MALSIFSCIFSNPPQIIEALGFPLDENVLFGVVLACCSCTKYVVRLCLRLHLIWILQSIGLPILYFFILVATLSMRTKLEAFSPDIRSLMNFPVHQKRSFTCPRHSYSSNDEILCQKWTAINESTFRIGNRSPDLCLRCSIEQCGCLI